MTRKQNKVVRLTEELLSQPHLISRDTFNSIMSYLDNRNRGLLMTPDEDSETEERDIPNYDSNLRIGIINIHGALSNKPIYGMCGMVGMSYQVILAQASEMISKGAKTLIMDISSGGGEAFNCFASANEMRRMCDENEVSLIAYVQDRACSAAYAWAVIADEVVCHPDGTVGSVGVLISLINDSENLKQNGYDRTFVTAGDNKIPFAEDGSWKKEFLADLQAKVDVLYDSFLNHVSKYTGLSVEDIRATQASTYLASKALELGMINKVMNNEEFVEYVANKQKGLNNVGIA